MLAITRPSIQLARQLRPVVANLTRARYLSRSLRVNEDSNLQTNVSGSGSSTVKSTGTSATPYPLRHDIRDLQLGTESTPVSLSSCSPNTVLTGLNYLKDQPPVLALPDEEYPPWLWDLLKSDAFADDGPGGKAEKEQLRKINRQRIREQNFLKTQ